MPPLMPTMKCLSELQLSVSSSCTFILCFLLAFFSFKAKVSLFSWRPIKSLFKADSSLGVLNYERRYYCILLSFSFSVSFYRALAFSSEGMNSLTSILAAYVARSNLYSVVLDYFTLGIGIWKIWARKHANAEIILAWSELLGSITFSVGGRFGKVQKSCPVLVVDVKG